MKDWLQGKGKLPVTYATLLDCLRDADLHSLAKDIEDACTYYFLNKFWECKFLNPVFVVADVIRLVCISTTCIIYPTV